jgi:hypothetical protein
MFGLPGSKSKCQWNRGSERELMYSSVSVEAESKNDPRGINYSITATSRPPPYQMPINRVTPPCNHY